MTDDLSAAAKAIAEDTAKLASLLQTCAAVATSAASRMAAVADALKPAEPYVPVRYGRFVHGPDTTPVDLQVARWPWQVLQGDHIDQMRALAARPGTVTMRYATPVARRTSDEQGWTQCLPPALIRDEWLLRNKYGEVITRRRDDDQFVDIGHPEYMVAAAAWLAKTLPEQGWKYLWLDEGNANSYWSYGDNQRTDAARDLPVKYPTQYSYRVAYRQFVKYVTTELRKAGLQVWVNLAGQVDKLGAWDAWTTGLADETDGHCIEFYIARGHERTASIENGYWKPMLDWTIRQAKGKPGAMFHAMCDDPGRAVYALGTYLLAAEGNAVFMASQDPYVVGADVWTEQMVAAQQLGRPVGVYTRADRVYRRQYEHGVVEVHPYETALGEFPPTSARIVLTSA